MKSENVISLPDNIISFLKRHIGNVQININSTDALNGYGIKLNICVIVSMYFEKCRREGCEYHSLFNPAYENKNINHRHAYSAGYENVFFWKTENEKNLEESFDLFLETQAGENENKPIVCTSFLGIGRDE